MEVNTTYEPYAQEPEYIETNRDLLKTLDLANVHKVLDLACGTGLLSDLLLQLKPTLAIYGADISPESLDIGRRQFQEKGLLIEDRAAWERAAAAGQGAVMLVEHSADAVDFPDATFDLAMMGNAIHLMPDKEKFMRELHRVLKPGGAFVFNSVFFVGTYAEGSEPIFTEWMKEAVNILNEKNQALRAAGEKPIQRQRGKAGKAFDKDWKSPEEWANLFAQQGFQTTRNYKRMVPISKRGLELVGAYGGLAEVLMSGYPVDIASECLQAAAGRAFANMGVTEVPRYWLEMTLVKQ